MTYICREEPDPTIIHIVQGILLGYRMHDIRAWHALRPLLDALSPEDADYTAHRAAIVANPGARAVLLEYHTHFAILFELARRWVAANATPL